MLKKLVFITAPILFVIFLYLVFTLPHRDPSVVTIEIPPEKPYVPPLPQNIIDEVNRNGQGPN